MPAREVSVIVPTYNRAHLIGDTIARVLAQTYAHCHAIVVDDGSTDDTADVIARRFGANPRVRYVRKSNGGVSSARNVGLAAATGDLIAFLDSDDRWLPWKLEVQVAVMTALADRGVGMVWTNMNVVDPDGTRIATNTMRKGYSAYAIFERHHLPIFAHEARLAELVPALRDPAQDTRVYWGDVYPRMIIGNLCQPSTVMITAERARQVGPFDEAMRSGEDHAYHLAAARAGNCALVDIAAVDYTRGNADQLTMPKYKLMIAQNYLKTITPAIARDRDRLGLPPAVLRDAFAEANAWLGQELLSRSERREARKHFAASLRLKPWQPQTWAHLAEAAAPAAITARLREAYRAWKRMRASV